LDHERGGEISQNLKRLYSYMQMQLLTAHARQSAEPIAEVASLLETLLDGWRTAAKSTAAQASFSNNDLSVSRPEMSRLEAIVC
jgi:flagellin-specific chaperone FliS